MQFTLTPMRILLIVGAVLLALGGLTATVWHAAVKSTDSSWVLKLNADADKHNKKVADLDAKIADLEEAARHEQAARTADYLRGITDGRKQTEDTIAELRRNNSGLWLQVRSAESRATGAENAAVQSKRDAAQAAQLTAEASESLIRIAADGDEAIKQLTLAQAEYKALYDYTEKLYKLYNEMRLKQQ
ncbi:hypothetical protein pEaSNUABM54_00051 [Erwinia phage pEa_SNUABM_54]|nr:hypothetical protein pEaSNUABM54_00051 [Erwinia phage pEa_SNUABM_54]